MEHYPSFCVIYKGSLTSNKKKLSIDTNFNF